MLPSLLIRATSDSIYHGTTESSGNPAIAINAEFQINTNWTAGTQYQDSHTSGVRQRHRNLTGYLGYDKRITPTWLSSTYYTHRAFLDSAREWDYDEFTTRLSHQSGISFGIYYAPNYYSSSVKSLGTDIQYTSPLFERFYWKGQIGNINIPSLFNYQYAELTVGTSIKRMNIELGYHWTSKSMSQSPIGNTESPKIALSISYVLL